LRTNPSFLKNGLGGTRKKPPLSKKQLQAVNKKWPPSAAFQKQVFGIPKMQWPGSNPKENAFWELVPCWMPLEVPHLFQKSGKPPPGVSRPLNQGYIDTSNEITSRKNQKPQKPTVGSEQGSEGLGSPSYEENVFFDQTENEKPPRGP